MPAPIFADRVQETFTTTGTGTISLGGAITGYQAFSAALTNAQTCYYAATDGTNWEVGIGTYTSSGNTLTRTSIIASSNAGSAVSWASGTKNIWLDMPATLFSAPLTSSLSNNVSLNNISNFFDGPSVAQGTQGTWFASGTVTVIDTSGSAGISAKLWDGTTVIASAYITIPAANYITSLALSGVISSPAGNIKISVNDQSSTSGAILYNETGQGKDSTLTAYRIR